MTRDEKNVTKRMTPEQIEKVGNTLTELFRQLEEVIIENVALKKVLKEAALPKDENAPPLPDQVRELIPKERNRVHATMEHLRGKILQAVREDRLPEVSDLAASTTREVN